MKKLFSIFLLSILLVISSCSSKKALTETNQDETSQQSVSDDERDGSSFEKAIRVKSIDQEYAYVREVCPDCRINRQSLIFHEKKPYDVLDFTRDNGEEVSYYFDISSFFGKGF